MSTAHNLRNQKGIISVGFVLVVLVLLTLSAGGLYLVKYQQKDDVLSASSNFPLAGGQKVRVTCSGNRLEAQRVDGKTIDATCTGSSTTPPPAPTPTPPPAPSCGNGICDSSETSTTCTSDCPSVTPPPPAPSGGSGIPFGPFHLPVAQYGSSSYPFTLDMHSARTSEVISTLNTARSKGMKLLINLGGGRSGFQTSTGAFDLAKFKSKLDIYKNIDFGAYSDVILGHLMIDEPQDGSNWNGSPIPYADVEAAAAYSKQLWPTMLTGVGSHATWLNSAGPGFWKSLDFVDAPYSARRGTAYTKYLSDEVAAAKAAKLGLVVSVNVLHGSSTGTAVSASDLQTWGLHFMNEPYICGMTMWKWDQASNGSYFNTTEMKAALNAISAAAKSHAATSCKQH